MVFKKILTEAPIHGEVIQPNSAVRNHDYVSEFKSATSANEKQEIINNFISDFEQSINAKLSAGIKTALSNFISLGNPNLLNYATNPMCKFIISLQKNNPALLSTMSSVGINNVMRLVSEGILNEATISNFDANSILSVNDLYEKTYNDMKYYVQCWYYLKGSGRYTLKEVLEKIIAYRDAETATDGRTKAHADLQQIQFLIGDVSGLSKEDIDKLISYVLFTGRDFPVTNRAKLRAVNQVEQILSLFDSLAANKKAKNNINNLKNTEDNKISKESKDVYAKIKDDISKLSTKDAINLVSLLFKDRQDVSAQFDDE